MFNRGTYNLVKERATRLLLYKYRYLYQLSRLLKNSFLTRIRLKKWFKKPNLK